MEENPNSYQVRLREKGQVTIPRSVRESIDAAEGDILTLYVVNDVILLMPRSSRIAHLSDQLTEMMEKAGVSLASLLEGLEEVRAQIAEERRGRDA